MTSQPDLKNSVKKKLVNPMSHPPPDTTDRQQIKIKKSTEGKRTSKDEKRLRQYVNIMRCIPSIASMYGITNIQDFVNSGHWNDILTSIDKDVFMENYKNSEEFAGIVDGLFRNEKTSEEHQLRLQEYMKFVS